MPLMPQPPPTGPTPTRDDDDQIPEGWIVAKPPPEVSATHPTLPIHKPNSKGLRKRSVIEFERDLEYIAIHKVRGVSDRVLADDLSRLYYADRGEKLSRQQVWVDTQTIMTRWRESGLLNIHDAKLKMLAEIAAAKAEIWAAWERSKEDSERAISSQDERPDVEEEMAPFEDPKTGDLKVGRKVIRRGGIFRSTRVQTEGRYGDFGAWLAWARLNEQEMQLLGLLKTAISEGDTFTMLVMRLRDQGRLSDAGPVALPDGAGDPDESAGGTASKGTHLLIEAAARLSDDQGG